MNELSKDGGPAFPWHQSPGNQNNLGMSLRDYFAAAALTGMIVNRYSIDDEGAACRAYEYADSMLRERANK